MRAGPFEAGFACGRRGRREVRDRETTARQPMDCADTCAVLDGSRHETRRRDAVVQLLPIYDEYLVAYRDREAVPHWPAGRMATPRGSMPFQHALVIRGQVAGTWKFTRAQDRLAVNVIAGRPLTDAEKRGVVSAASRFERFLDARMSLSIGTST